MRQFSGGIYAYGLTYHRALPGVGAAELNRLLAFELFLLSAGTLAYYVGLMALPAPSRWVATRLPRASRRSRASDQEVSGNV